MSKINRKVARQVAEVVETLRPSVGLTVSKLAEEEVARTVEVRFLKFTEDGSAVFVVYYVNRHDICVQTWPIRQEDLTYSIRAWIVCGVHP